MPNKTTNPKKTEVAPKDGSVSTPKDNLSNTQASWKQWLKSRSVLVGIALALLVIVAGFVVWKNLVQPDDSDSTTLSEEEREYQRLVEESTIVPSADQLEADANNKESEIENIESDDERAGAYYELADIYLSQADFDNFFVIIKKAEDSAKAVGDTDLQTKIKDLKDRGERVYEQLEGFL